MGNLQLDCLFSNFLSNGVLTFEGPQTVCYSIMLYQSCLEYNTSVFLLSILTKFFTILVDLVTYITRFQWDMAKYPIKQSLKSISEIIAKVIYFIKLSYFNLGYLCTKLGTQSSLGFFSFM